MSETLIAHCPLCAALIRFPVRAVVVGHTPDGTPVVAVRGREITHHCHATQEHT